VRKSRLVNYWFEKILERETGFEPATSSLGSLHYRTVTAGGVFSDLASVCQFRHIRIYPSEKLLPLASDSYLKPIVAVLPGIATAYPPDFTPLTVSSCFV
jgi:hypothetical protein